MDMLRMKTFVRSHVLPYDLVHVYLWIKYYINTWHGPLKTSCKNYKKILDVRYFYAIIIAVLKIPKQLYYAQLHNWREVRCERCQT